jgi:NAD(P)-dependent dehydrogenase (short-subunit alcohol dehydrogenase family)
MIEKKEIVLITGATKGIGRAIAEFAALKGWAVLGIARNNDSTFPGILEIIDLENETERLSTFLKLAKKYNITRLVNNAGVNRLKSVSEVSKKDYERILSLNLTVPFELIQAVLPTMLEAKFGRIVNIASRSLLGRPGASVYSSAKSGLIGLTRTLSMELAVHGITVNAVSPGPIATEMFSTNNPPDSQQTKEIVNSVPMKRMGQTDEVAAAVGYFLSNSASYTTGQNLYVCGGSSVGKAPI